MTAGAIRRPPSASSPSVMKKIALVAVIALTALLARSEVKAQESTVQFSGYKWAVRDSAGSASGPGPNVFSHDAHNVHVDAQGNLHLSIQPAGAGWTSAELTLSRVLGYGTYQFDTDSGAHELDPNAVLGFFTWSDAPAQSHREIDIEFARWGHEADPLSAQYVVQPYQADGHLRRWARGHGGRETHTFRWAPGQVYFESRTAAGVYAAWNFVSATVPTPEGERVHLNLWLFEGKAPFSKSPVEVVIANFRFTPLP